MISFEEFKKMELKIGTIKQAEPVPGADKLLKLIVDTGEERQLVAGIAQQYKPYELIGKQIVVVTNLEPAKIRGVESNGMLLAAEDEKNIILLTPDKETTPGSKIR